MQPTYTSIAAQSINSKQSGTQTHSLSQRLQQLGRALVRFFAPDDSITVRRRHRNGQPTWVVYDRYTNQRHEFMSEQEVMTWVECNVQRPC